ncbi:TerY-C metal binding domain-containing protein [Lignipirellula cremea]|uniref:von Willebrand factor type A domain protein n=1 Tax=Lignipirellula cremea TaxID=2528010 RepID=A0A518DPU6_9BACT|nr:TerY-C metal binding domain-containing protein [Lignipirellula cremea]QDU93857.1 von Willebrand factor type A domain protein [Lignipirellula cremea]
MHFRRLPIYLLLDCSESMAGEAIEQVERGMHAMVDELKSDPSALETAWISVITFSRYAKQETPLTELVQFQPPRLTIRPGTALGTALRLLTDSIGKEVRKTSATQKGDYRPIVFLFTDGQPTDEYQAAAARLRAANPRLANIYAIGCGPDVDSDVLRSFTDIVLNLKNMTPEGWRKTFVWLTASVQSTSIALERGGEGKPMSLPNMPSDTLEIAPPSSGYRDPRPRQVFLYSWCEKTRQPYLMRFIREEYGHLYNAAAAHKLDQVETWSGEETSPGVNTDQLQGVPACPYCANPIAAMCYCGALSCAPLDPNAVVTCPKCNISGTAGPSQGGFDVRGAEG